MKFLIIGASGFIGSHTYKHIKSKGYEVIGTQTKPRNNDLKVFDLLGKKTLEEAIGKEFFKGEEEKIAILMAATRRIDDCAKNPVATRKLNVNAMIKVAKYLHKKGVKIVFISSSAVFDGKAGLRSEHDFKNPICEYGRQKSDAEDGIKNISRSLILRFEKALGTDPSEEHLFSNEWYALAEKGEPIICMEGHYFPATLVDDLAKAILLACEKKLTGIYHVANPESVYRTDLAKRFVKWLELDSYVIEKPLSYFNFKDERNMINNMDVTKFIKATGMKFTTCQEMIEKFAKKVKR